MKITHTEKLFYNKFPYRLHFIGKPDSLDEIIGKQLLSDKFHIRQEYKYKHFYLYLLEEEDYRFFSRQFKKYIQAAVIPGSDENLDLLKTNSKVRIRNSLYWKKYPYKIDFYPYFKYSDKQMISAYLSEYFKVDLPIKNEKLFFYWNDFGKPMLFLTNRNDLIIIRIALSDYIKEINQVKLERGI